MSGSPSPPCVIGVADHAGWAHLLAVAAPDGLPHVIARRRITLIDAGLPTLPYHHESLPLPVDEADRLIARVRRSVADCTTRALQSAVADLTSAYGAVAMVIREPSFPALPKSVADVRQSYQLQCAADGMLYQLALCDAARAIGLDVQQCRRGAESALAATRLGVRPAEVETYVAGRGRPPGPPWTEEHRRSYAAAIAALAAHQPIRLK